jgi:drug/metabolite transporter (DMT)-like permease
MTLRSSHSFGLFYACLGALAFSFKAIFIKAAYAYDVDAETLLALRMGYSLPFFVAMGISIELRHPLQMTRRDISMLLLLGGVGYYAASYLDFLGLRYISAALDYQTHAGATGHVLWRHHAGRDTRPAYWRR